MDMVVSPKTLATSPATTIITSSSPFLISTTTRDLKVSLFQSSQTKKRVSFKVQAAKLPAGVINKGILQVIGVDIGKGLDIPL